MKCNLTFSLKCCILTWYHLTVVSLVYLSQETSYVNKQFRFNAVTNYRCVVVEAIIIFDEIELKPHTNKHLLKPDIIIKRVIKICITKKWLRD